MTNVTQARTLAVALPAGLLAGAYISQYVFGLYPCEMCWWQRYPHFAAIAFALMSFVLKPARTWIALAGLAIITSGLIGGFHAGVEYDWWEGVTSCANTSANVDVFDPRAAPLIRCDIAPWHFLGISLAGWNFLISTLGGIAVLWLSVRSGKRKI